jgi:hypothetical protein
MKKLLLLLYWLTIVSVQAGTSVRDAFQTEMAEAKPWCYWYWMHGCVSKAGIEADLKAMQEAGLGGAFLFAIRGTEQPSKYVPAVETLSPEWFDLVKYAVEEAGKRNLQLSMHISDGFALAGGPWIKPEQSMQKLVWSSAEVKGSSKIKLAQPASYPGYYKDVAVFAYPSKGVTPLPKRITVPGDTNDLRFLADSSKIGSFRSENPVSILYEYAKPFTCRSIVTKVNGTVYQCHRFLVEASDDGRNFRFVAKIETPRHGWQNTAANVTHAIPPTKAKYFRFSWTKEGTPPGAEDNDNAKWKPVLKLSGLYPSAEPRIDQFEGKNGSVWRVSSATTQQQLPLAECLRQADCIDLTDHLKADGLLDWKAPKGNWTILRIGHTSTGQTNATAGAGAGLECDKFNPQAVQAQFDGWFGKICSEVGSEQVGKVLSLLHIDSWECGSQNWSPVFAAEFARRRGYDLTPWLPVMAGVPLVSPEASDKFLHDVRRTQAELVHDVFFQTFAKNAHAQGCQISAECVAPTMVSDGLSHYEAVDYPMGEFWLDSPTHDKPNDMLDAITGAHLYGKPLVWAEGFTELKNTWDETPSKLKALLDLQFANGLNKMVFHVFVHNPFVDRKPGMTLDGMGLYFQRDQTWWKPAKAWMNYIQRCQRLLQLGHPVTDIAVFGGFELPFRALQPDRLVPALPGLFGAERVAQEKLRLQNKGVPMTESPVGVSHTANITLASDWINALRGYSYDTFNPEVLLSAKVEDGRLRLKSGASYSLLVLPGAHPLAPDTITPYKDQEDQLRKTLADFLQKKLPVLLPDYLAKDLKAKASIPWKQPDFCNLGISRDLDATENGLEAKNLAFTHRADEGMDLYFLSNQSPAERDLELSFRVSGRVPECYDPMDGRITGFSQWKTDGKRTEVHLKLAPHQALFVVFEKPALISENNVAELPVQSVDCPGLQGPWTVRFDKAFGGPVQPVSFPSLCSWSLHDSACVRYYSGTASYQGGFTFSASVDPGMEYRLSLGKVAELAEVYVNGLPCGTAWTEPFSVDISKALRKGENQLEIRVTNTWANRLEGDALLPEAQRVTWTDGKYRKKTRDLLDAGLLGPLRLTAVGSPVQPKSITPTSKKK